MAAPREAGSFKFSTDDLPEAIRSDVVRELYERATLPHRPEPFEPVSISPCVNITKWRYRTSASCSVRLAVYTKQSGLEAPSPAARMIYWSPST